MAIELTKPIDISAVNAAVVKHKDVLKSLDTLDVNEVLADCTGIPAVTNSITLGRVENGSISSKYTGVFLGDKQLGKITPRTLTVYPVVAEMADEPERYRRSFITEVSGGLWDKKHPFEVWLIQHGVTLASQDLHNAIFVASYSTGTTDKAIENAFNGWGSILMTEKTASNISVAKNNLFATGTLSRSNIGDKLLEMYRSTPPTFRKKNAIMWISQDLGDLYDDWMQDETMQLPGTDESGHAFLKGTNKKCKLKRTSAFPAGSQFVLLTTKANMVYGYEKPSDLKSMKAFPSGNPYQFTAAMKYVWGTQFVSIHGSELKINDQPLTPTT